MNKWFSKLWAQIEAWWKANYNQPDPEPDPTPDPEPDPTPEPIPEPVPGPGPVTPPSTKTQVAVSWHDNAAYRQMNDSAEPLDTALRRMRESKATGANTVNWYLFNYRDGRPVPSTIYKGAWGAEIDTAKIAHYRSLVNYAREEGVLVNWWFLADDGGIPYKDAAAIKRAIVDVCNRLGDVILSGGGYVVIALESNETITRALVRQYAQEFKRLLPGVRIANHMTSGQYSWSRDIPEIDAHFHQTAPRASVAAFTAEIRNVVSKVGKPVIACEFSLIGTDSTAKEKARIALDAGCVGVHSGVPK